jgi:thioesterase domain-containing protein/acyl carrier protein
MARVFHEGQPPARLLNGYGPTETTTLATWHQITAGDAASGVIPIGRALMGRTVSVRDENLDPVDVGQPGELLIGGPAVAHEYWNAPELTQASFVEDPHAPGMRLYRSGDLCKELPNGRIVFLGRKDEQVKIRGFRVELTGVSSKILEIPGVQEAVVLARSTPFGSKELIAFVRTLEGLTAEQVRARLIDSVEDYFVPARILQVGEMPLTANGKVDRAALLNLCESGKAPDRELSTPVTATESALVSIWQQLFRRDDISTRDGFFALGGDSLQMMELVARVEIELDTNLGPEHVKSPLQMITLAKTIDRIQAESRVTQPVQAFVICSPWTMRGFPDAYAEALAGGGESRQLQVPPSLFNSAHPDLMKSMVSALQSQVLAISPDGPYRIAGYSFSGLLAFELARCLEADGHKVELLVLVDTVFGRRSLMGLLRTIRRRLSRRVSETHRRARENEEATEHASKSPILNQCIREARQYRPGEYSGGVMLARSQETVSGGFACWRTRLKGEVIEHRFDGNHLSLILDPTQINQVAAAISEALPETVST